MIDRGIKCAGIDTLSIEQYGSKGAPAHKLLLSNDVGIIENLNKLKQFVNKRMFLVCLPLPLKGVDGSPARAVLFEMIK
jgi:arylformamidase